MTKTATLGFLAVLLSVAGCGDDVQAQTGGAGGTGGNAGPGGQGGGGEGATGGASDGGGGSGGVPDGTCTTEDACAEGTCIFPQGSCAPGAQGSCQLGFTCDGPPSGPLCGCNGEVVEGEMAECTVWGDGVPYSGPELCAKGTFTCGDKQCTRHVQVCVETSGGAVDEVTYQCVPLADIQGTCAHGIADCSCLDATSLGCPSDGCCKADADHQETIQIALP
jgi:hypothetical protein